MVSQFPLLIAVLRISICRKGLFLNLSRILLAATNLSLPVNAHVKINRDAFRGLRD